MHTPSHARRLPWFKAFASDLASASFYSLSAAERGLLDSMSKAYWNDGSLPKAPMLLARVVRLDEEEVTSNLTEAVLAFFVIDETNSQLLHHVDLKQQREQVEEGRRRMSEGGKRGADIANANRRSMGGAAIPSGRGYPEAQDAGVDRGTTSKSSSLERVDYFSNTKAVRNEKKRAAVELTEDQQAWANEYAGAEGDSLAPSPRRGAGRNGPSPIDDR